MMALALKYFYIDSHHWVVLCQEGRDAQSDVSRPCHCYLVLLHDDLYYLLANVAKIYEMFFNFTKKLEIFPENLKKHMLSPFLPLNH